LNPKSAEIRLNSGIPLGRLPVWQRFDGIWHEDAALSTILTEPK